MLMHISKYVDDIYTCNRSRCGFCREECPVYQEFRLEAYSCRGRIQIARGVIEEKIAPSKELLDCINLCTTCGYCRYKCALHNVEIIEALRADLVKMGITDKYHDKARKYILKSGNPMNSPSNERTNWTEGLEFDKNSPVLFYAGCIYSHMYPDRLRTIIRLLNRIGIKLNYLFDDEKCCGNLLYSTGYWDDFETLKKENQEIFKKNKIEKIVTPCPGCAKMLTKVYSESDIEVLHIVQYYDELIETGKMKFSTPVKLTVTWHDPCDLARHLRIIDEPRRILNEIPGLKFIEMEHNKYDSKCCGAGGGMLNSWTDVTMNIAQKRMIEAQQTGAEYIVTSCPTCESTLERIIRYEESELKVLDLSELILKSV
ncbi:MAG: hypothetical protein GF329_22260 [Candidatus Lokiarchaeota archaeon]|nr:hypothetical protein [Candidatus Lokiarchaeota archaeon]